MTLSGMQGAEVTWKVRQGAELTWKGRQGAMAMTGKICPLARERDSRVPLSETCG